MRFNEAIQVCNSMPPQHIQLHNNNQLQRSSSELLIYDKSQGPSANQQQQQQQQFFVGQDSSTYSSLAVNKLVERRNLNNNLDATFPSSSTESLADYQDYYEDEGEPHQEDEEEAGSDWSEYSEDANLPAGCRGIVNPNYPGFQHLGPSLLSDTDDTEDEHELDDQLAPLHDDVFNNNNNSNRQNHRSNVNLNINLNSNNNNNNSNIEDSLNRLDVQQQQNKQYFYEKPKFNIQTASTLMECMSYVKGVHDTLACSKIRDEDVEIVQLGTGVRETLQFAHIEQLAADKHQQSDELDETLEEPVDLIREASALKSLGNANEIDGNGNNGSKLEALNDNGNGNKYGTNPFLTNPFISLDEPVATSKLIEDIDLLTECRQVPEQQQQEPPSVPVPDVVVMKHKHERSNAQIKQRSIELAPERDCFEVYNMETAMPKIDMDAIEMHLKAARAEERRRHNDREEIRKRLAMGPEAEQSGQQRRCSKPSLQSRLQSGMNLQICFMNESAGSDTESLGGCGQEPEEIHVEEVQMPVAVVSRLSSSTSSSSSSSACSSRSSSMLASPSKRSHHPLSVSACNLAACAGQLELAQIQQLQTAEPKHDIDEADVFARQARLQTEARLALAQAKEMAHMQMEMERQKLKVSPITDMVRSSLNKIGVTLGEERRRLTRALLTELNIAQLQVLANDLHARIATLNEALVQGLLMRDDLHMEQDSMLVDVEDLTRYIGAKQQSLEQPKQQPKQPKQQQQSKDECQASSEATRLARQRASKTLAMLRNAASQAKIASQGRQLVANLVRK